MENKIVGIISLYNDPDLDVLTLKRGIASLNLLSRYSFIDFALSNLLNSGIDNIIILIKRGSRSLLKHLDTFQSSYPFNPKRGSISFFIFEGSGQNTELNNIRHNLFLFNTLAATHYLFITPEILMNYDYREFIESHKKSDKDISLLSSLSYDKRIYNFKVEDYKLQLVRGDEDSYNMFLYSFIINQKVLKDMINDHSRVFILNELNSFNLNVFEYDGFYQHYYNIDTYYKNSLEILNIANYHSLFDKAMIYTRSYDSPPAKFLKHAKISNSLIANGAILNGTIKNSIIGRHVKVGKNALIINSIIMAHTEIADDVVITNCIIDKSCYITKDIKNDALVCISEGRKI